MGVPHQDRVAPDTACAKTPSATATRALLGPRATQQLAHTCATAVDGAPVVRACVMRVLLVSRASMAPSPHARAIAAEMAGVFREGKCKPPSWQCRAATTAAATLWGSLPRHRRARPAAPRRSPSSASACVDGAAQRALSTRAQTTVRATADARPVCAYAMRDGAGRPAVSSSSSRRRRRRPHRRHRHGCARLHSIAPDVAPASWARASVAPASRAIGANR